MPEARRSATARSTCSAEWPRRIHARAAGSNVWLPIEARVTPAARHARAASGVTSSGLTSSVTSAASSHANQRESVSAARATPAPPRREGVPPPK
jgi:hypothetical protein